MEQVEVGTSGLPPLLAAAPVPVPVADPEQAEQAVEQDMCSLTELVPVRSKQPTTATDRILTGDEVLVEEDTNDQQEDLIEQPVDDPLGDSKEVIIVTNSTDIAEEITLPSSDVMTEECTIEVSTTSVGPAELEVPSELSIDTSSEILSDPLGEEELEDDRPGSASGTPSYHIPPHLLGRTVENPESDTPPGRRTQKPRLGVRVPYRNLTSQIVTQNEIAQEIFERAAKKNPGMAESYTEGGHLATTDLFARKLTQRLASSIIPTMPKSKVPDSMGSLKSLLPTKTSSLSDGLRLSPGFTYSEKDKPMDDADLLSILEGDGEPLWLPDKILRKVEGTHNPPAPAPAPAPTLQAPAPPPQPVSPHPSPPKLDPALEKELALKQLMELPMRFPAKKPEKKSDKPPRQRKVKVKKEAAEGDEAAADPLGTPAAAADPLGTPAAAAEPVIRPPAAPVAASKGPSIEGGSETPAVPSTETEKVSNGAAETEIASPNKLAKKATSGRKRKMSAEVAAVLKKPKLTKQATAVTNGKAKGGKNAQNPPVPQPEASNKKKPAAGAASKKTVQTKQEAAVATAGAASKKTVQVKQEAAAAAAAVTNGNVEPTVNKRTVRRTSRGKTEEIAPKKVLAKTAPTPPKTVKPSSKAASKPPTPAQTSKPEKSIDNQEESIKKPTEQPMEVHEITEDLAEEQSQPEKPVKPESQPPQPKKATRINRELEYLLGDEGAVNMLYAVEGHKRKVPSSDLALKARLVKTAVMRLSTSPQGHVPLALRARRSLNVVEPPKLMKMSSKRKHRQHSSESHDSLRSPPYLTPVDGSSSHAYSPRQKLTADDSRIIRRHSSSSSFSSPSVSPRRASVDDGKGDAGAASSHSTPSTRKKGVPIFVRDTAKNMTYSGKKKPKMNIVALDSALELNERLLNLQGRKKLLPNPAALKKQDLKKISSDVKNKVKSEMFKTFNTTAALAAKKAAKLQKAKLIAKRKAEEELAKVKKAEEELQKVQEFMNSQSDELQLIPAPAIKQEGKKSSTPISPDAASYSNLLKALDQKGKKGQVEERQRATARQCAGTYNYKEITVRRYDSVVHITLAPVSTKMRSALNVQVLRELRDALQQVRKDDSCRVVLLTSTGPIFCQGVDVTTLIHANADKRKAVAIELSLALKDFLKCVAHYPKPLVAGVQGAALGLGVTMLPLFDMVFASDKATFHTPYAQLGQVPEGGATLTLPYLLGHTATSELLLNCRQMTANEALKCGLVTRTLWPDKFLEELVPLVKTIAQQSAQSMEATKALLRHGLRTKFDAALESETHLLVTHWTSQECQTSFLKWIENEEVSLQRQRSVET